MNKLGSYLEYFSLGLLSLFLLAYPLLFTTLTTDTFIIPKQLLLIAVALIAFLALGLKTVFNKTVVLRRTPFDIPVLIFLGVVFLGSILAVNRSESLTSFATLFFAAGLYFLFTNTAKSMKSIIILLVSFLEGVILSDILFGLNFFKVYILPVSQAKTQTFTTFGSLLDLAVYTSVAIVLLSYLIWFWKTREKIRFKKLSAKAKIILSILAVKLLLLAGALGLSIYSMVKLQNPVILPFETGFQVSFAAISQDSGRWLLSFLFGSGYGTFATDFARFKQAIFNQSPYWNLTFFRSSSFVLELLATTGILGLLSFFYLSFRVLRYKSLFVPFAFFLLLSFLLPMSTTTVTLFFVLLGLFAAMRGLSDKEFFDVQLALVTLKSGLLAVSPEDKREVRHGLSKVLPAAVFLIVLVLFFFLGSLSVRYALANKMLADSLFDASQNKGSEAYNKQSQVLTLVSYNDAYQRIFSQTNLALANSLSQSTPKGASPSAQTQQTIYTLIQQSINSARLATTLSPNTSANWQNLSGVYRSLIGFGKNADQFAVLASQQAALLDPTNPQEYLNLGGLYYQLNLWDKAVEQFTIAINLKKNLANSYYNLAHALQQKGDLRGALDQLEIVKSLVKNDPGNLKKVQAEIDALNNGLKAGGALQTGTQLPPQYPPVAIPAPATPKPSPTPTPAPQQPLGATPTPTPGK